MTTTATEKRINVETTRYEADVDFPEAAHYPEFVAAQLTERYGVPVECSIGQKTRAFLYGYGPEETDLEHEIVSLVKVELWDEFCDHGYKEFADADAEA